MCLAVCDFMDCRTPSLSVPHHLPKFAQVHVHCISDAIQPPHPLTHSSPLSSIFPSIRDFSSESAVHIRLSKYWSFSFSISPSNEYSGLISLKIDWFGLLSVQGTLRSLLQHHSSKASILQCFFLLYGPALTTICDQWENQSLDKTDFPQQSNVSAF